MNFSRTALVAATVLALPLGVGAIVTTQTATADHHAAGTIVDVAGGNEELSTLVTAVVAADLATTLSGDGPFTVFAPNNDAFGEMDEDELTALLADKAALTGVLTYHVVAGKHAAADLMGEDLVLDTVSGGQVVIQGDEDGVYVNGTEVVTADVKASNGIIHIIDGVISPEDNE